MIQEQYEINLDTQTSSPVSGGSSFAACLLQHDGDPGAMRPYLVPKKTAEGRIVRNEETGKPVSDAYMTINGKAVRAANATLQYDEWKQIEDAVVPIQRNRLVAVQDLISRGLTTSLPGGGLGTTVVQWQDVSDMTAAEMNMDGATRANADRFEFDTKYLPVPIISKMFQFNARELASSRSRGMPLDTRGAVNAARKIREFEEDMLLKGVSSYAFGGGTIYGYLDFPSANSATLSANWTASAKTAADILADVLSCKQALINDNFSMGPYSVYVPQAYDTVLDEDYDSTTATGRTIRQRLESIDGLGAGSIKVADRLTANKVVMLQLSTEVVDLVQGMQMTPVEWSVEGGMILKYKLMSITVPRLYADQDGRCGIVVLAAA